MLHAGGHRCHKAVNGFFACAFTHDTNAQYLASQRAKAAPQSGGRVSAIDIRNPAFPSSRGVRVGTPLANLQAIYGDALKQTVMTEGNMTVNQWALTSPNQYIAYIVDGTGTVTRIAIGYRGADDSITLPPPC